MARIFPSYRDVRCALADLRLPMFCGNVLDMLCYALIFICMSARGWVFSYISGYVLITDAFSDL